MPLKDNLTKVPQDPTPLKEVLRDHIPLNREDQEGQEDPTITTT